mgnify:CR=1 FL=1
MRRSWSWLWLILSAQLLHCTTARAAGSAPTLTEVIAARPFLDPEALTVQVGYAQDPWNEVATGKDLPAQNPFAPGGQFSA